VVFIELWTPAALSLYLLYQVENQKELAHCGDANTGNMDCILWSGIARNDVILMNAGEETDGSVTQTAQDLLNKPSTPGFEFHTQSSNSHTGTVERVRQLATSFSRDNASKGDSSERLKGIKFHVYEQDTDTEGGMIMWVFAMVYRSSTLTKRQAQGWLEKIVVLTENFREHDRAWRYGGNLAAQPVFEPILRQRMQEVTHYGKIALLEEQIESTKLVMERNIELILEREEKLEKLNQDASNLQEAAQVFKKRSKQVRRMKMMQDAKYGLMVGALVTGVVAVIVVPPLVAIL
jgi:Synaptobrevin